MSEEGGFEDEEAQREKCGKGAEHLLCSHEDEDREGEAEENDDEAAAEEDGVSVGGVEKLGAVYEVLPFEVGNWDGGRIFEARAKQRDAGEQFGEGRMLGFLPSRRASNTRNRRRGGSIHQRSGTLVERKR
jgi:hypothetical protein